jgi:hypothetical protein
MGRECGRSMVRRFGTRSAECGDHIGIREIAARKECANRLCSFQASALENGQSLAGEQAITRFDRWSIPILR